MEHREDDLKEKGFARLGDQIQLGPIAEKEGRRERGAAVAQTLAAENFADSIAKAVWDMLSEEQQHSALADFQCTDCLLMDTQGITREQMEEMTYEELDAALEEAVRRQRVPAGSPQASKQEVTQIDNIRISFDEDGNGLQIHGNCQKCGGDITRTLQGEKMMLINAYGRLLKMKEKNGKRKTGRNDPCPCGSGKKYKKCCGGIQADQ